LRVRQNRTTPTLTPSPRSTRGTTRRTAYSNGSGGMSKPLDRVDERGGRRQAREQVRHVGVALGRRVANDGVGEEPRVRDEPDDRAQQRLGHPRRPPSIGGLE